MAATATDTYAQLCDYCRETSLLSSIGSLLGWDERTMLPAGGGAYRAEQMTYLAGSIHRRWTDPRLGEWLDELAASPLARDPASDTGATIRELIRQRNRRMKLPQMLVEELARTSVLGQQSWQQAREQDDFASFCPLLERTFVLKRQEADALGFAECHYDALLDEYEPGELTSNVARVLGGLRDELVPLVREILDRGRPVDDAVLHQSYPVDAQEALGRHVAAAIGFDFKRGRLDVTAHPFCETIGPNDCRITTRYRPQSLPDALFGILHEAGHGIYEQGLQTEQFGLPLGAAVSLGIHESQSRMWENQVGRSLPFWQHFYPAAQRQFPASLSSVPLETFYAAINVVRPSLVRVEADEATYNLHIFVRFELEQALLEQDLAVADLPEAWNAKYREYVGIEPPNDAQGVLQDIHWSAGLVGYFPTYSLGNLYAAQFFVQADQDLGGVAAMFAKGQFGSLKQWLIDHIHRHGQRYSAAELIERATGRALDHGPLIDHLRGKLGPLYGIG